MFRMVHWPMIMSQISPHWGAMLPLSQEAIRITSRNLKPLYISCDFIYIYPTVNYNKGLILNIIKENGVSMSNTVLVKQCEPYVHKNFKRLKKKKKLTLQFKGFLSHVVLCRWNINSFKLNVNNPELKSSPRPSFTQLGQSIVVIR